MSIHLLRAYNDWHIDEWCGTYPGRFMPLSIPPIWDPQLMADEVRRVAKKGCHAVTFSENPYKLGWPHIFGDHWDPFFQACEDEGTVICLHIGSSSHPDRDRAGRADRRDDHAHAAQHDAGRDRPAVEPGAAQVPEPAVRAERGRDRAGSRTGSSGSTTCTTSTASGPARTSATRCRARSRATTSRSASSATAPASSSATRSASTAITWECDYPHSDSEWPNSPESVDQAARRRRRRGRQQAHPRERDADLPVRPVRRHATDQATVGALRAQVTD